MVNFSNNSTQTVTNVRWISPLTLSFFVKKILILARVFKTSKNEVGVTYFLVVYIH